MTSPPRQVPDVSPDPTPRDVAAVLLRLQREPGRPRLTWYGGDGERVELSGAVVGNWVTKTTNFLVEEHDAGAGVRVLLDLPPHWRTVLWALGVWRAGACVLVPGDGGPEPDLVVTDRPVEHHGHGAVVAVALPALARRFDGPLLPGTTDAAAAVMTYGDVLGYVPPTDEGAPALVAVAHRDLVSGGPAPAGPGARVLEAATGDRVEGAELVHLLRTLAAGASVVLLDGTAAREVRDDTARRDRLVAGERVTVDRLGP